MFNKTIGIKVDVDTFAGMREGVPRLLDLFTRHSIHVSFFVPMGRDNTGRTIKRVFKKGFLKKAGRVKVLDTYGVKTLMYGLILRGPDIPRKNTGLLRGIIDKGHELGIHGLDHVYWHDHIKRMDRQTTQRQVSTLLQTFREVTGNSALSFAAPGWMINPYVLQLFQEQGLVYSSDTRGTSPFLPEMDNNKYRILQIPTTLPTLDEVIGISGEDDHTLAEYYTGILTPGLNILTVHTELEGKRWIGFLDKFISKAKQEGFAFHRLIDIAGKTMEQGNIPSCRIVYGHVDGRALEVCCQVAPRL